MKKLPLEGVRIADLTMMWAGPFATRVLAEMGAEVIKIESPRAWDNIRTLIPQPGIEDPWNSSFYFNDYNRDKKSLTLDLAQDLGKQTFLKLVAKCDVVIENYRADVMDNLGLGYEVLRAAKPDIILISMAGYGKFGPEKDQVGFGPIIEQMSGLASMTGYGDDGVPTKTGLSYGDPVAGKAAAAAVALSLIKRRKTGEGSNIDLGQREVMSTLIGEQFVAASLRGEEPVHRGNRDARYFAQGVYRCAGTEQWIAVTFQTEADWLDACSVLGGMDRYELKALSPEERQSEVDRQMSNLLSDKDPQWVMEMLQGPKIPAGRVLDTVAIHEDPHLAARGFWVELPHPKMAPWKQPRSAWNLQAASPLPRRHAPLFGEHNDEILRGLLGMSEAEIADLREHIVISDAPVNPGVG
jgi:crotonobetainyl-CoA:carnitine CoA-transferase CaiB-like acyl-CoA transferase